MEALCVEWWIYESFVSSLVRSHDKELLLYWIAVQRDASSRCERISSCSSFLFFVLMLFCLGNVKESLFFKKRFKLQMYRLQANKMAFQVSRQIRVPVQFLADERPRRELCTQVQPFRHGWKRISLGRWIWLGREGGVQIVIGHSWHDYLTPWQHFLILPANVAHA